MYTRCPACHTVHPVNAALLARGRGRYRCAKCNKSASALEALFDEWPDSGQRPPAAGDLPVLGLNIDLAQAERSRLDPDVNPSDGEIEAAARPAHRTALLRAAWMAGAAAIVAAAAIGLARFYQVESAAPAAAEDRTLLDSALEAIGAGESQPAGPFRDLDRIYLVSRELTSHPEHPDRLRLNATLVNRAARVQPFPDLEITLLDAVGEPLTRHRFEPADYLAQGSMRRAGMAPEAYLPLTVDLEDPGLQAVGFELEFR
jgi:predicted Zn finger-like uncharacterized protein